MKLDVCFRPAEVQGMNLRETLCIVLDIFRATTCMTTGMKNGCKAIVPVLSLEDARQAAQEQDEPVLLAGERQSLRLEGCELGNSPFDYAAEVVGGRVVVATTSNGTVAIKATDGAYRTLIGSFLNASAVCEEAVQAGKDVLVVCAGTDGLFSLEDSLCAGLLLQRLSQLQPEAELTDAARAAIMLYTGAAACLLETAVVSRNGQRLQDLNRMEDVRRCFEIDAVPVVPEYRDGVIRCIGAGNR